jgi:hypothetical protein
MILADADAGTGRQVEPVVVDRATGRRVDGEGYIFTTWPAAGDGMRAR